MFSDDELFAGDDDSGSCHSTLAPPDYTSTVHNTQTTTV